MTEARTTLLEVRRTARIALRGPADAPAIWYLLHGQAMKAHDFIEMAAPLDDGSRLLVAPEALNRHYTGPVASRDAPVGATWMTREERDADIRDYVTYLDEVDRVVSAGSRVSPRPRTLLGFSQGGAAAVRWAASGHVQLAHLIVWESSMPPEVDARAMWERCGRPRLTYVCGDGDKFITPKVLSAQHAIWEDAGLEFERIAFHGGHRLDAATLLKVAG